MAERLVDRFGREIPEGIARRIAEVHPRFPQRAFVAEAARGYEALDLMARGRHLAQALRAHLPQDFEQAIAVLEHSLGPPLAATGGQGLAPFFYLPHSFFVQLFGLDHFEVSMRFQHALTRRFTAEFSIRPFIERHPRETFARLTEWARDPDVHVRRLVSEGTRPRLPWAPRLRALQADPRPGLALLELLRDDPEPYVRRSVANHLNDIGKDHPALLLETARRWLRDATPARRWIVERALRSVVKRADPQALALLGFGGKPRVTVRAAALTPARPRIGEAVVVAFEVVNGSASTQRVLVDFRVHFVKASGRAAAKTFKLKAVEIAPRASVRLQKRVSLAELTTRRHYPGEHRVEAVCSGKVFELGSFELRPLKRATAR
jgi:3-methyladenine DNA glycosylase AlkC